MSSLVDFFRKDHGLRVGDPAPDVRVVDQEGTAFSLADAYARGPVFLYFYVRANTPVCTVHACRFRDGFAELQAKDVQVFGVSNDPPARLVEFKKRHRLPFRLLSDAGGAIAAAFQVPSLFGFTARDAYLIRDGRIVWKGHASQGPKAFADFA